MTRAIHAFLFFAFLAVAPGALAQDKAAEKACRDDDNDPAARIAACTALIDAADTAAAWMFVERGDALQDASDDAGAIADFSRALEIEPDNTSALGNRVVSRIALEDLDGALADATRLVTLKPDNYWNHYWLGRVHEERGDADAALASLSRSVELKGDWFWSYWRRGIVLQDQGRLGEAALDLARAAEIRPFEPAVRRRQADVLQELGDTMGAAGAYRILYALDPENTALEERLSELLGELAAPSLPAMPYAPPAPETRVRYMQVLLPVIEQRDEMEEAIFALADWFRERPRAKPLAAAIQTRVLTADGDTVEARLETGEMLHPEVITKDGPLPTQVGTLRGLILTDIPPGDEPRPHFRIDFTEGDPRTLWPLAVGNSVSGKGLFQIVCPESFHLAAMLIGCLHGVTTVEIGSFDYVLSVEGTERVHVPLGVFDTFVLRYREQGEMRLGGTVKTRELETKWWLAPELGYQVRATSLRGDKIMVQMAIPPAP